MGYKIKDPTAEASYRQMAAIGVAVVQAAYPEGMTKGEASGLLDSLKAEDEAAREEALRALAQEVITELEQ